MIIVLSFIDKSILKYIHDLNSQVKLKIITHHQVLNKYIDGVKDVEELADVKLVSDRIHAKVYIFDWEKAIISSVNLNYSSWAKSIESGIIIEDSNSLNKIKEVVENIESHPASLEIKDEDSTKGNSETEDEDIDIPSIKVPFELEGKKIIKDLIKIKKSIEREAQETIDKNIVRKKRQQQL